MSEGNERPAGVPEAARWDGRERAWGVGEGDIGRKKVGTWRWWDAQGAYLGEATYDGKGHLHGPLRRYHPTGQLGMEGRFDLDHRVGRWVWYLPTGASRDLLPSEIELNVGPGVTRVEGDYSPQGQLVNRHYFSGATETTLRGIDGATAERVQVITSEALKKRTKRSSVAPDGQFFVETLRRLDAWLERVCSLGQRDVLLARFPTLLPEDKTLVVPNGLQAGSVPSEDAVKTLQSELRAKLPGSYVTFLRTVGWVDAGPDVHALRVGELAAQARAHRSELHAKVGGSEEYGELYAEYLDNGMADKRWNEWAADDTERILRPDELVDHNFLPIEFDDDHRPTRLLALHLRDDRSESPVFSDVSENLQIYLVARDAYEWFELLVEEAIANMARFFTAR